MPVIHKILQGQGAAKWLPFARSKLARLAEECERARAPHRRRSFVVDAGMVNVKVAVKGSQHYIEIVRRPCPPFLSGICELVLHKEGDQIGADVPFTPIYQVDDPDSSDPEDTIEVFRRFFPSPATPAEDREWRDDRFLARNQSAAKQMITLCGSMFSGEMRQVVQVLQGMNVTIPYSPLFNGTHGVFKTASGARWVIEISNFGVLAWPMKVCRNPILGADGEVLLPYHPIATPKPRDEDGVAIAEQITALATASEVQEPFNQIPFFAHCGWAFDADGHHASNVVWNFVGPEIRSYIYTITISEVDDRPSSATIAKVMEGQLTGSILAHMKYPAGGSNLYSFDHRQGGDPHGEPGPVFCFYDGPTLVWVRRRMVLEPSTSIVTEPEGPCTNPTFPFPINIPLSCLGTNCTGTQTITQHSYFEGSVDLPALTSSSAGSRRCRTFNLDEYAGMIVGDSTEQWWVSQSQDHYSHTEQLNSVIVVPWGDREGFYFAERLTRAEGQQTHQYDRGGGNVGAGAGAVTTQACSGGAGTPISYRIEGPLTPAFGTGGVPLLVISAFYTSGTQYYPGAHIGEEIEQFYDFPEAGNCTTPKRSSIPATGRPPGLDHFGTEWTNPAYTVATYKVTYRGSGGLQVTLPTDESADPFLSFLETPNSQAIVAVRDAFSDKILLYERPNHFAYKSTASQYPSFAENRPVCFIGVP